MKKEEVKAKVEKVQEKKARDQEMDDSQKQEKVEA